MAAPWRDQSFSSPIDFSSSSSSPRHTPDKTADIGQDGVSLSTDLQGRILQLSAFHPEHGVVVAEPFGQFDGSKYYDPKYVRSYRTRMLQYIKEGKGGFGLDVAENANPGCAQIITHRYALNLCLSLNRASYGQLTEGGPIPLPPSRNILCTTAEGVFNIGFNALSSTPLRDELQTTHRPQSSYLVTGKPKDQTIFQLDQQCYPLLELCDYLDCFPHDVDFVTRLADSGAIAEILEVLAYKRDAETGLWATDETPGDDAVTLPYHFSSHVLLWRTYKRLRDLWANIKPLDNAEIRRLSDMATDVRDSTLRFFTAHHPQIEKSMFAYLTDGQGEHTFYHDANDVPTLFAMEWKFVETPNQITTWRNTMDFGLSPSNERGFCAEGPYRGLGSQHSPGAWVLGYFQELAYAAFMDDAPVVSDAWEKILAAMQWDGTFSEAVDSQTAECSSKAWFSWPGSMIGALLIRMRANGKDKYLERYSEGAL
ncbi:hypothetical protein DL771_006818 [Monosporascus sp. 5C6A]|nr:hypothetical protein DL771_006818 [Monosporascus sp. 5C6A]